MFLIQQKLVHKGYACNYKIPLPLGNNRVNVMNYIQQLTSNFFNYMQHVTCPLYEIIHSGKTKKCIKNLEFKKKTLNLKYISKISKPKNFVLPFFQKQLPLNLLFCHIH